MIPWKKVPGDLSTKPTYLNESVAQESSMKEFCRSLCASVSQ